MDEVSPELRFKRLYSEIKARGKEPRVDYNLDSDHNPLYKDREGNNITQEAALEILATQAAELVAKNKGKWSDNWPVIDRNAKMMRGWDKRSRGSQELMGGNRVDERGSLVGPHGQVIFPPGHPYNPQ